MIGTPNILDWTLRAWHPELLYAATAVLVVHDILIVTLSPRPSNEVRWTTLFAPTPPKSNATTIDRSRYQQNMRFGVMLRYHMGTITTRSTLHGRNLHHGLFVLPGGEMMNMPRPFIANGCSNRTTSSVYVQTDREIVSYNKFRNRTRVTTGAATYAKSRKSTRTMTTIEEGKLFSSCRTIKLYEGTIVAGFVCLVIPAYASTVDSEQGQTRTCHCLFDMTELNISNYLVALMRANHVHKTHVSNVLAAIQRVVTTYRDTDLLKLLKSKRVRRLIVGRYEHFR